MKQFMDADFLLHTETAKTLFHKYAEDMPIFDFHCHLPVKEIWEDKKFRSITEAWLGGDHYKWRLLREMGIPERNITGDASDKEKFDSFASVMPYAIGNPIYHWTHLELQRYFGITEPLSPKTADKIYEACNKKLETLTARQFVLQSGVKKIYTTDDPVDSLEYHQKLKADRTFDVEVYPAFRPDKALHIDLPTFAPYIATLAAVSGKKIASLADLVDALYARIAFFAENGCVCSDHALDEVRYADATAEEADAVFEKAMKGEKPTSSETAQYEGYILRALGAEYARRGWVQQYHIGAQRNNSTRAFRTLGPDTGYDAIGDGLIAKNLAKLLDALDSADSLPKTILYCLNPRDNEVLCAMKNCFQRDGIAGKIQFGSGWWHNDQLDGMRKQMTALSHLGLLSRFVGMLTDSRSFLSYTRHEYFRRLLCDMLGDLIENGEYPADLDTVGEIVKDISYRNAMNYFA